MPKLIKDGAIIDNQYEWQQDPEAVISANSIVSAQKWLAEKDTLGDVAGIWLEAGDGTDILNDVDLNQFDVIGIHFPAFADGRGFSYARLLRERFNYQGEVRALGDFIPDQLGYLLRVGFNGFQFAEEVDLEKALLLHKPFSVAYQGDVADPRPIFLRR
ncbi:DUF934 domain-containing protein [Marinomonas posidonica]|uniref:Uncharacterized conserved protein UCP030820 n=1 Tax=Marinomonas posidonica (strain CECT 7376 / NCIMB 14433 / IVIA-Po-181) TaxID=491952 RepID=F6CZD9_MARPP|nr:DUF934 domain-containing protein [Marinomonas posidonica]AEF54676.1 Uncharacterized conserved protein UCP030820 [Marinomonas posidonica IVIA-Po-181]